MDFAQQSLVWLIVGVVLIAAELLLPGLISVFLGLAALVVAALIHFGFVASASMAILTWVVVSVVLVLTLRSSLMKFFPGDTSVGSLDEDAQAKGSVVDVVRDVAFEHSEGQVNFRDALWSARSLGGPIRKGERARLVRRENIVWLVEPV